MLSLFYFNDPATTEIYTLSLHDALPIFSERPRPTASIIPITAIGWPTRSHRARRSVGSPCAAPESVRSEEHTSELQSQSNLVCRLLLEKKKYTISFSL